MKNLGGVFVVLLGGCCFAMIIGITRWFMTVKKSSKTLGVSL